MEPPVHPSASASHHQETTIFQKRQKIGIRADDLCTINMERRRSTLYPTKTVFKRTILSFQ
jgi:hypothetical protein